MTWTTRHLGGSGAAFIYFSSGSKTGTHPHFKQKKMFFFCICLKKLRLITCLPDCHVSCNGRLWCHIYRNIRWKFFPYLSKKWGSHPVVSYTQSEICSVWPFSWRLKVVNRAVLLSDKCGIVIQFQHCFVISMDVTSVWFVPC